MKDIADDLGLSLVTISKAIRNHPDIANATRERVLKRAKEMKYRPNLVARSLVTGHSSLVGLVVPDLIHPYFAEIAKALSTALRERNLFLIVASSDHDPELERAEIEHILAHRLDALVVASVQSSCDDLQTIQTGGTPLILFDRSYPDFDVNFVGLNDHKVGELAAEHLLSIGRKHIVHIRGPENSVSHARMQGFVDVMQRRRRGGIAYSVVTPNVSTDGRDGGEAGMEQILQRDPLPDAVFCYNDAMAIGAMIKAFEFGLQVPDDLAIIGCGNYPFADALRVPLSSIDQQVQLTGVRIARMIFKLLETDGLAKRKRSILDPILIARNSTRLP